MIAANSHKYPYTLYSQSMNKSSISLNSLEIVRFSMQIINALSHYVFGEDICQKVHLLIMAIPHRRKKIWKIKH